VHVRTVVNCTGDESAPQAVGGEFIGVQSRVLRNGLDDDRDVIGCEAFVRYVVALPDSAEDGSSRDVGGK
jgi:hypothetical protein